MWRAPVGFPSAPWIHEVVDELDMLSDGFSRAHRFFSERVQSPRSGNLETRENCADQSAVRTPIKHIMLRHCCHGRWETSSVEPYDVLHSSQRLHRDEWRINVGTVNATSIISAFRYCCCWRWWWCCHWHSPSLFMEIYCREQLKEFHSWGWLNWISFSFRSVVGTSKCDSHSWFPRAGFF